jgi:hypothetical protein
VGQTIRVARAWPHQKATAALLNAQYHLGQ